MRPVPRCSGVVAPVILALGLAQACGGRHGEPPSRPPRVNDPDGEKRYLVQRGPYKAFYDRWGRIARIEHDSNGDGKADRISYHNAQRTPYRIEVDTDLDGRMDRWESYDERGTLLKFGVSRQGRGPDMWVIVDLQGRPQRREYDDDHDGKIERAEILRGVHVIRTEIDGDRDGRIDRWQSWVGSLVVSEELDTDSDGKPDRRVHFSRRGGIVRTERLAP
jgi:hypothetical protein